MTLKIEWKDVNDEKPVIPKGKFAVSVILSVHDPVYEEINPGRGSDISHGLWDGEKFIHIGYGGNGSWDWTTYCDVVTHWMYEPEPVQVKRIRGTRKWEKITK